MDSSYAVTWREPGSPVYAGKLEFSSDHVRFDGAASGGLLLGERLRYADVRTVRLDREEAAIDGGRQAIVLERRFGPPIRISTVAGPGALSEMAARFRALSETGSA